MPRASKSNVPQPLKWNIESAAREFGLAIGTLRKALNKNSTVPDADGLYSTQQICMALFGVMHHGKIRTQRQAATSFRQLGGNDAGLRRRLCCRARVIGSSRSERCHRAESFSA